jgi:TonB-dependent starch-binding outer membrane protein SusC
MEKTDSRPSGKRKNSLPASLGLRLLVLSCVLVFQAQGLQAQDLQAYAHLNQNALQNQKKISLRLENLSLLAVLDRLEKESNVIFIYANDDIDVSRKVSLQVTDTSLDQTLKALLAPLGIDYELHGNKVVLAARKEQRGELRRQIDMIDRELMGPRFLASPIKLNQPADITVTGRVLSEKGEELPGVTVVLKGSTRGTSTDAEGRYSIIVPDGNGILIFSYVGYLPKEESIGGRTTINVSLAQDAKALEELVVVGYGTQKKVNLTGSVATLDAKFLADRPITNASQALQGVPGVYVNMSKGRPGADGASIRIRGANSYFTGSDPLVLVNGVPFDLRDINPNDIENITVLKDAASAAIYGNRAQNGVILVTTKSGLRNSKVAVDYTNYVGYQEAINLPQDVVWNSMEYMEGKNRARVNEGQAPEYDQNLLNEYRAGTDPDIYPNTNWFDVMFRKAMIQEHNLRLSGGGERSAFSVSLGYLDQDGVLLNTGAKKYSLNASISADVTKWLKVGANVMGTYWDDHESAYTADEGNGEGGVMGLIFRGLPIQTPVLQDGSYADHWIRVPGHNFFRNPYALSYEGFRRNSSLRGLANMFAEVQLPYNLKYKVTVAPNLRYALQKYHYPQIDLTHPKTGAAVPMGNIPPRGVRQESLEDISFTNFHTLDWNKNIGTAHTINALVGYSIEQFYLARFDARNQGYLGNEITDLVGGSTNPQVGGSTSKSRLLSYFGRVSYSLHDKYLFETNFRYDGSSRFGKENRWGFFPSLSAGWRINEEDFLKDNKHVSNLKLRASWGQLGNQNIPLFSFIDAVATGVNYNFNNTVVGGAAVTQITDPDLSWERTTITNIGIDAGFFNNKLTFEFDLFDKLTSGILARINIAPQIGDLTGPITNLGSVSNKGYEITTNYRNTFRGIGYNVGGNVTYVQNMVVNTNGQINYDGNRIIAEGHPIQSFFGLETVGIFQNEDEIKNAPFQNQVTKPGDLRYRDQDGNGIIDSNDRVVVGRSLPAYTYSFTFGADFKGFDFSAFFQGVSNVNTFLNSNLSMPYRNGAGVTREWLTDSWTPENPNARLPRLTTANGYPPNFQFSDFWLQDVSYLRLKNLQVGYTLPAYLIQRSGMSRARIFVNAQNLLTFTSFKDGDPERNVLQQGIIAYPIARAITAGVNIGF